MNSLRTSLSVVSAFGIIVILLVSGLPSPGAVASSGRASTAPTTQTVEILPRDTQSPIKHVIIAIYENHGIDNTFSQHPGVFANPPGGVPQPLTQQNVTGYNTPYFTGWNYGGNESSSVPDHDVQAVRGNMNNGSMNGFSYTDSNVSDAMFPSYLLPNLNGLAEEYALADMYFQAYAGPTLPNRFYDYAATSGSVLTNNGPTNGSNMVYFDSMPEELEQNGLTWASYDGSYNMWNGTCVADLFCNVPSFYFSTTLSQLMPMLYFNWIQEYEGQRGNLQEYTQIFTDLSDGTLPTVSWYTPDWLCCTEHPGTIDGFGGNMTQGEQSLIQLVAAVEDSPYWNSTAIFVTYDEGGGFYDDVPAPQITTLGDGGRIPLVVISAYTPENYISHEYLSPSSILRFIEWNWNLPPLGYVDATANNPLDFFNFSASPRAPLPQSQLVPPNNLSTYPWSLQPVSSSFSGKTYVSALVTDHNVTWADETTNTITSSPALSPNGLTVYESGMDGVVRAFNALTGAPIWTATLANGMRSGPTVTPSGDVIVTTIGGVVASYSPTGTLLWTDDLTSGGTPSPIYAGLTLDGTTGYGTEQNGSAFALNTTSGHLLWWHQVSTVPIYSAPLLDPSPAMLLYSVSGLGIVATDLNGKALWTAQVPGGVWEPGVITDGIEWVGSVGGGLWPVTLSDGSVGNSLPLNGTIASPVLDGNLLVIGTNASTLEAYTVGTGGSLTPTWSDTLFGALATAPVVSGNDLWLDTEGGDVREVVAATGATVTQLQSKAAMWSSPVLGAAGLFFTAEDGGVYGLVTGGGVSVSATPATATVLANGQPLTLDAAGQGSWAEPVGSLTLNASALGYTSASQTVTIAVGAITPVTFDLAKSNAPPATLEGRVAPSSATLTVDGTAVCTADCATYSVSEPAGSYALLATDTGYVTQGTNLTVAAGGSGWWNVTLQPVPGSEGWLVGTVTNGTGGATLAGLTATLEPGAYSATTGASGTFNVSLAAGTYSLFLNATHFKAYSTTDLTVTVGLTTTVTIALQAETGSGGNPGGGKTSNSTGPSGFFGLQVIDWLLLVAVLVVVVIAAVALLSRRGKSSPPADEFPLPGEAAWSEVPPAETTPDYVETTGPGATETVDTPGPPGA